MKKNIVYAEMGNPWRFLSSYEVASSRIQFKNLHNFAKEGPLCGNLYINGENVKCPFYNAFGGPILLNGDFIYLPLYQVKKNWKDIVGGYLVKVEMSKLSFRVIGHKQEIIYLDHLDNDNLYFYNSWEKSSNDLKIVNIKEQPQSFTLKDKVFYIANQILKMIMT